MVKKNVANLLRGLEGKLLPCKGGGSCFECGKSVCEVGTAREEARGVDAEAGGVEKCEERDEREL